MGRRSEIGVRVRRFAGALSLAVFASMAPAADSGTTTEQFMIPAVDPGIELYLRNKHPSGAKDFAPGKILLFVHGATYPAESAFDLELDGLSWMDYIAQHGYDVYMVDLRGYGKSTRPAEMSRPAADKNATGIVLSDSVCSVCVEICTEPRSDSDSTLARGISCVVVPSDSVIRSDEPRTPTRVPCNAGISGH